MNGRKYKDTKKVRIDSQPKGVRRAKKDRSSSSHVVTTTEAIEEECPGHDYEFLEPLPSHEPDRFQELWVCIHCNQTRVLTHHVGICD